MGGGNIYDTPHIPPAIEVIMKRFIAIPAAIVMLLLLGNPLLAASLGISPSSVELEVPGDGSATADLQAHYFSGDLEVSLVDIPLRVEPETLHVDAIDGPVDIQLTIYGDESLGSQVYDGYIKFLGMSGETVALAVQVKAKVTHIVEGQPLPEEPGTEETPPAEETPELPQSSPDTSETTDWPILPLAGIAAGAAVLITIIVMVARRRRY
jgi:hypothetical protein